MCRVCHSMLASVERQRDGWKMVGIFWDCAYIMKYSISIQLKIAQRQIGVDNDHYCTLNPIGFFGTIFFSRS